MTRWQHVLGHSIVVTCALFWVRCSAPAPTPAPAGDATGESTPDSEVEDGEVDAETLALRTGYNRTYPKDLAVTSVTAEVSEATLSAGTLELPLGLVSGDDGDDYLAKRRRFQSVLTAESLEHCADALPAEISLAQGGLGHTPCFGPEVTYTQHPDGVADGSIGSGDLGIFWEYSDPSASDGPACSSAVANTLMDNIASYADTALGLHAWVTCVARLKAMALPAAGESLSLSESLEDVDLSDTDVTVSSAQVSREVDDIEGHPVYVTQIEGTLTDRARELTKAFSLRVRNIPEAEDYTAYRGSVQFVIDEFEDTRSAAISLRYRWSDKRLRYQYRQMQFNDASATMFAPDSAAEGGDVLPLDDHVGSGFTQVTVDTDHRGFGALAYVWATSDLLVLNVRTYEDGTGSAYFGHQSMTDTAYTDREFDRVRGLRCLPIQPPPEGVEPYSDFVQQQSLALSSETGIWAPTSSKVTFAPTADCSWNSTNDPGQDAVFTVARETGGPGSEVLEDLAFPLEPDLEAVAEYEQDWQGPEAP